VLRAGIVGCGRIGSEFDDDPRRKTVSSHAGAYTANGDIDLVAVSDLDEEKLQKCGKRWGVPSLYKDYREMLREQKLDILSICTWNSTHLDIVREAVAAGVKAVFCEKPIADSLKNADEMVRLCGEKGVILQIDHQRRFDTTHRKVRDFIQAGKLGGIQQVTCYYTAGIANTGSHIFDLLRFFFGDVEWVQAVYSRSHAPNTRDPDIDVMLRFKSGASGVLQACDVRDFLIFEISCLGTKGRINLIHSGFGLEYYEVRDSELFSGYREIFRTTPPFPGDESPEFMASAVSHLVKCLKDGQPPASSGEDGRASLELICAARESAEADGRRIILPLKDSLIEIQSR
jgi:predicted dehydrogenase